MVLFIILTLIVIPAFAGLILAFLPSPTKTNNNAISAEETADLRQNFIGNQNQFTTTDGETLFLRRWDPEVNEPAKKDIAVLIFHGITAHSGPYEMAGTPISSGGYTTFGLDYRGHGLSDGNRGDSPNRERWIADLEEAVKYIKSLGFQKTIILGHSLGVASAICVANAIPNEISGLVLLSGAHKRKKGLTKPPTFFQKFKIISSSFYRPSYQVVEYYREGMKGINDPLFNFKYTPRFMTMLDVKQLKLPETMNIPVLVGVGDKDELFEVDKVLELYDAVPGNKKNFLIMKNATHTKIHLEYWKEIIDWLDKAF
jgi:alpha-beta hydrolase superfamily lysophospholipase